MSAPPFRARAFGEDWTADLPLPRFDSASGPRGGQPIAVRALEVLPEREILKTKGRGALCADGFRVRWMNEATFDVIAPRTIGYVRHEGWRDALPEALYSTVAALVLVGLGKLALHASAVELGGRAYLFMGRAGAGKSTLAAELLEHGARLIGDDLTVLDPREGGGWSVPRGRPAIRLHPDSAIRIAGEQAVAIGDPRGKLLVEPAARVADRAVPLGGLFLLSPGGREVGALAALPELAAHLFRPGWQRILPGHGPRRAALLALAAGVPVRRLPPVSDFAPPERNRRLADALAAIEALA